LQVALLQVQVAIPRQLGEVTALLVVLSPTQEVLEEEEGQFVLEIRAPPALEQAAPIVVDQTVLRALVWDVAHVQPMTVAQLVQAVTAQAVQGRIVHLAREWDAVVVVAQIVQHVWEQTAVAVMVVKAARLA
jgi:hypothetical protein